MTKYSEKYPDLFILFCGYFNQDWADDYDSPEEVISGFTQDSSQKDIMLIIKELETLLQEDHIKEECYELIGRSFGCAYSLKVRNIDLIDWLKKIKKQFEDELEFVKKSES